jgi:hypothetical protein
VISAASVHHTPTKQKKAKKHQKTTLDGGVRFPTSERLGAQKLSPPNRVVHPLRSLKNYIKRPYSVSGTQQGRLKKCATFLFASAAHFSLWLNLRTCPTSAALL